jgi:uncharacterized phage protein (TIGR02220 family)
MSEKDAYFFKHDSNARNDPRMIRLRRRHAWEGYGLYWALIEMLRDESDYRIASDQLDDLQHEWRAPNLPDVVQTCIEIGLLQHENNRIGSPALDRRMEKLAEKREKGRQAALRRWGKTSDGEESGPNADPMGTHEAPITNRTEQNREEQSIETIREAVSYLNEKTGRSFKATTESTKRHICARLREGMTADDLKAIVDHKSREWKADPKMAQYLRPETLFGSKAESYLEAARSSQPKRSNHIVPVPCPDCGALNDPDGHICRECKRDFTETFRQMHEEGL